MLAAGAGAVAFMALKPENPLVGGNILRRAAIQTPNFVTGVSGWQVKQDGTAEFNSVTIRNGTVISGTALYYSGAPALGNLVASISSAAGTDSLGNAYLAGIVGYNPGVIAAQLVNGSLSFYNAPGPGGPWSNLGSVSQGTFVDNTNINLKIGATVALGVAAALISANVPMIESGTGGGLFKVQEVGGAPATAPSQLIAHASGDRVLSSFVSGDTNARLLYTIGAAAGAFTEGPGNAATDVQWGRVAANVFGLRNATSFSPQTMAALVTASHNNFTAETIIGTYTIPAGDAANGSSYTFWGAGVAGDVLTPTLQLRIRVGGLTGALIGNTGVMTCRTAAGMAFSWNGRLAFTTAGAASVIDADTQINEQIVATTGGGHPLASQGAAGPNTTAAVTVVVTAAWGTASASNTIQTSSGTMERIQH